MLKTLAPAALILVAITSTDAAAAGWGFTHQQSLQYETRGYDSGAINMVHQLPTFDIRATGWLLQIDALETVASLTRKEVDGEGEETNDLNFGIAWYTTATRKPIKGDADGGDIQGVLQPGARLTLASNTSFDPATFSLLGGLRMGAQASKGMGFGMYVIPQLGIASVPDNSPGGDPTNSTIGLAVGGQFQVSVWMKVALLSARSEALPAEIEALYARWAELEERS